MSVRSKIFIVNVFDKNFDDTNEILAYVNMERMSEDFINLFTEEITHTLYIDSTNTDATTDMYGKPMKFTSISTVIKWLEDAIATGDNYRRLSLLLGLLKGIDKSQWEEIEIVHYGY
jgi:hypothetical protein